MQSKYVRGAGAIAALALIGGCATSERAPPPSAAAHADAGASRALAAQASAFESFVRKATSVDGSFSGPGEVSRALAAGASHDPQQLQAGMVAYAAMAALQEPRFVAAVRAQRGDLARRLAANPQLALELPGGDAAAARAAGALYAEGQALEGSGQQVKRASYSVQRQAWSKADAGGRPRLERVKRISQAGYQPARDDSARLMASLSQGGRRGGTASPLVARGVALAALTAMGQEGAGKSLMSDPKTSSCLRIAKLNYYQCLSAAGPHYEDIYCLGAHAMIEPGQCVVEATKPARSPVMKASYRR